MKMYELAAVMVDCVTQREYTHKLLCPAVSDEEAKSAAVELGFAVNSATGHRMKLRKASAKIVGESYLR